MTQSSLLSLPSRCVARLGLSILSKRRVGAETILAKGSGTVLDPWVLLRIRILLFGAWLSPCQQNLWFFPKFLWLFVTVGSFLCLLMEGNGSEQTNTDLNPDPDPGGPKIYGSYGSRSGILWSGMFRVSFNNFVQYLRLCLKWNIHWLGFLRIRWMNSFGTILKKVPFINDGLTSLTLSLLSVWQVKTLLLYV